MGVPLLLTWLRKRFAECFLPADSALTDYIRDEADNLFIDLNSFLYQAATIITATHRFHHFVSVDEVEDTVLQKLFDLLDDIVFHLVQPTALVYIAVDGVAPLGKMAQQRARRRRGARRQPSYPQRNFHNEENGKGGGNLGDLWDGNCISVGTRFMAKVTEALHFYAASRTERINLKRLRQYTTDGTDPAAEPFRGINIVIDDVLRPGEGENKIAEVIRRIRTDPAYNPNTSHIICSSDTDVTVTSLILHEPRIHVLRYEPPPSLGGKPPAIGGRTGAGSNDGAPKDSWLSTFFSIHIFRHRLREMLHLSSSGGDPSIPSADRNSGFDADGAVQTFESALHDVVFVLLLFGNDFLPTIGGSIQEGTLDALLSLLATDFVPRGRKLVDPHTNQIQYASARYLLSRLSDLPRGAGFGCEDGLQIHNGSDDAAKWGFETEDPRHADRQARREKQHERMCFCYWTMLQWALQYSAGIVEHWGSYYPYSRAPPLSKLAKYCGVLSYDVLGEIARKRLERAKPDGDDDDDGDDVGESMTMSLRSDTAARDVVERGKPTDVMVQLLILIPPRSIALLPTTFRHHYKEIEGSVQASVELLDLVSIGAWCDEKKRSLSEEERIRFNGYRFFASDTDLCPTQAVAVSGKQTVMGFAANEITFIAYWSLAEMTAELQEAQRLKTAAQASVTTVAAAAMQSKVASFFGSSGRRLGGTNAPAKSIGGAMALLENINIASSPIVATPCNSQEESQTKQLQPENEVEAGEEQQIVLPSLLKDVIGSFVVSVAPCALLPDASLAKAMGTVHGNRFICGSFVPSMDSDAILTRHPPAQGVRLRFDLAVVPGIVDTRYEASLLPGYREPTEVGIRSRIAAERRKAEDRNDPWKMMHRGSGHSDQRKRDRDDDVNSNVADEVATDDQSSPEVPPSKAEEDGALLRRKEEMRQRVAMLRAAHSEELC